MIHVISHWTLQYAIYKIYIFRRAQNCCAALNSSHTQKKRVLQEPHQGGKGGMGRGGGGCLGLRESPPNGQLDGESILEGDRRVPLKTRPPQNKTNLSFGVYHGRDPGVPPGHVSHFSASNRRR